MENKKVRTRTGKIGAQGSFQLEPKDNRNHAFPSNMLEATWIDMALSEVPNSEVIPGVRIGRGVLWFFLEDKLVEVIEVEQCVGYLQAGGKFSA